MTACIYFSFWWIIKSCQPPTLFEQLSIDICRWTWWSLRPLLCSNSTWKNRPEQHLNDLAVSTLLSEHYIKREKGKEWKHIVCLLVRTCQKCVLLLPVTQCTLSAKWPQNWLKHTFTEACRKLLSLSYVVLPKNLTRDKEVKLSLWKRKKSTLFL